MASLIPIFESSFSGTGSVNAEAWVDISGIIPSGKQIWLGYATFISNDKTLTFEVRPNLPSQSTSGIANTQLRSFVNVPSGESRDVDFYYYGNINTFAPSAPSTGVEKLWLRVKSGSSSLGTFDYIIYYTLY